MTNEQIDELLAFLPLFDQPGGRPIDKWVGGERDAAGVVSLPYPAYNADVLRFFDVASQAWWSDTGYDPATVGDEIQRDEAIASASLKKLRTLLTYCVRGERFCDGHWASVIEQGHVLRILRRLRDLRMRGRASIVEKQPADVMQRLLSERDDILGRLTVSHLTRYSLLQGRLHETDVSSDAAYRRCFNGFYRMQRRSPSWHAVYFELLQRNKANPELSFAQVLQELQFKCGTVEPSFASKLVATVNPQKPVYDRYVRENLGLKAPAANRDVRSRIAECIELYARLEAQVLALTRDPGAGILRASFVERFREFQWIGDTKLMDLCLWQLR